MAADAATTVLTIRVPRNVARKLAREARRQRRTRSAVARDLLIATLEPDSADLAAEAKRQSLLVRKRASERDAVTLLTEIADLRGWE